MAAFGMALLVFAYACIYSGVMTLRAGSSGTKTGVFESLNPKFDAVSREGQISGGIAKGAAAATGRAKDRPGAAKVTRKKGTITA